MFVLATCCYCYFWFLSNWPSSVDTRD